MKGKDLNQNNNNPIKDQKNKPNNSQKFIVTSLSLDFYRRIIELENKIQFSHPSMEDIKELGTLYKKAIEVFCTTSQKKVRFFQEKLNKLLLGVNKLAKKQNKKPTKWSQYMNSHKKNYNNFMLFLEIESSDKEGEQILINQNEKFAKIFVEYNNNIDTQKNIFRENMRLKKEKKRKNEIIINTNVINNEIKDIQKINEEKENINTNNINNTNANYNLFYNKFKGRNDLVDLSYKDFLKKFHYIYLNSKIFKEPIESFNYILDDIFCHKVTKYFDYQEQIKEFEMILEDKDQRNHEESLTFFVTDIQNERKKYYQSLENFVEKIMKKIQMRCAEAQINKDKNIEKYICEFMKGISKIFY